MTGSAAHTNGNGAGNGDYRAFLERKVVAPMTCGPSVLPGPIHPLLHERPHQAAIVDCMVRGGRRACFAKFGLGKGMIQQETMRLVLEHEATREASEGRGDAVGLIIAPLGVRQEFKRDAAEKLGREIRAIRTDAEITDPGLYLTHYEAVRDGKIDVSGLTAVSLDEASVLRGFGGTKTFREFMRKFHETPYRFVATATPSPNEYIELLSYAAFLGIMDVGEAKTRFFRRNSEKADQLTLHPHKEAEFWTWVHTWAVFLQQPSDLGFPDDGYELPPLEVQWHCLESDIGDAGEEKDGQQRLIRDAALGVQSASREKRTTVALRVAKIMEIIADERVASGTSEGVPEGILRTEQGAAAGGAAGAWPAELPGESGAVPSARRAMEGGESGAYEGVAARARGAKPREDEAEESRVVPGESGARTAAGPRAEAQALRTDNGGVRRHARRPARTLRDLSPADAVAARGSLSRNGTGARAPLHDVQRGARDVPGRPDGAPARAGLPDQFIVWCDLNAEQDAIEAALDAAGITYSSLRGSQSLDERSELLDRWRDRSTVAFVSKPSMYGAGINMQQCHTMIFVGIGFKAQDLLQAIHRIHRFQQEHPCRVHLIYTQAEHEVRRTLEAKWARHDAMMAQMSEIIREYGLHGPGARERLVRTIGVSRQVDRSADAAERAAHEGTLEPPLWEAINDDTVEDARARPSETAGLIVTSIPFGTQYEYTPSYNDFGHTDDDAHFWEQMAFLSPELLRILQPGRVMCVHVKDRVRPGGMDGFGFQTVSPFHADAIQHYRRAGFAYLGMITVATDVVRENNQTYRLGWTEQCKDGSRMGVGMPEYVLLFRKPPTDRSDGYADVRVVKEKAGDHGYSRARWQIDAHAVWRSNGNRLLTAAELAGVLPTLPADEGFRRFRDYWYTHVYDHEAVVAQGEALEAANRLPPGFMLLQPPGTDVVPDVWTDVARMRTLNGAQEAKGREMHLCLARGSLVLTKERGYVPIETVRVGEHALTHRGRWRPVLAVQNTGVRGTVEVRAQGVPGLTLTPDHKLWTRAVRDLAWSKAHSRLEAERTDPDWVEAQHVRGSYVNLPLPPTESPTVDDPRVWWIVGRWLADGHLGTRGDVVLTCGAHEVRGLMARLGARAPDTAHPTGTAHQLRVKDAGGVLRAILARCGEGAAGKHLPPEAFTLPVGLANSLLTGYLSGDGHQLEKRRRWTASSVSRELLMGVAVLAQRVHGAIASVYPGRPARADVIEGRRVSARQDWVLCFDLPRSPGSPRTAFTLPDGAWKKVRQVEEAGEVETWNLRVEEDESFTAEGCVVKNCPLQFDIVDRLIGRYSNPGELVYDPFGGLGTVALRAIELGRRGLTVELNPAYHADAVRYLRAAEAKLAAPTLFDLLEHSPAEGAAA